MKQNLKNKRWNKMKHKVGDKVRISPDLRTDIEYGMIEAVEKMWTLIDQILTISETNDEVGCYLMEEDEELL